MPSPRADAVDRPGLPAERTSLSWRRTGLSLGVAGLLVSRGLLGAGPGWALGTVVLWLGVALAVSALPASGRGEDPSSGAWAPGRILAATSLALVLCAVELTLILS